MSTCQIISCRNNYRTKESRVIHFHRFPRRNALLLQWEKACGRKNINIKNGIYEINTSLFMYIIAEKATLFFVFFNMIRLALKFLTGFKCINQPYLRIL